MLIQIPEPSFANSKVYQVPCPPTTHLHHLFILYEAHPAPVERLTIKEQLFPKSRRPPVRDELQMLPSLVSPPQHGLTVHDRK
ncbi:hypothetical protein OAK76_03240 [Akkermansiaceae bacterium]|nr:hypothetical protein [Akkermansiaceae bacterium]